MKLNISILKLMFLSLTASLVGACTDKYGDFNTNPYEATYDEMQRDGYLMRASLTGMEGWVIPLDVNTNQFIECLLGGSYGGYFADSNSGFNGKNFAQYSPENHWLRVAFNDVIPAIFIRESELANATKDPVPLAVGKVIKVAALSRVTDIYGPIPYSQVGQDGKLTAPYDSQKDIYIKMISELDEAIETLTENQTNDFNENADRVYKGKVIKWIKLANSLKLRLAMRIVNVLPDVAQKKAEEAANHSVGTMSSNDDNAYMTVSVTNPFRVIMYEYNNGDSRISADITSYMNGYKDPRREKYFTNSTFDNTTNGYIGLRSGIQIPGGTTVKQYTNMNVKTNDKVLWMNAAEIAFLKAEGALRGWNMGTPSASASTPQEGFYNQGIELSFEQWGASNSKTYISDATSMPNVHKDLVNTLFSYDKNTSTITIKWNESEGFEKSLERIITQKWIANFPLGIESWSEYRRTGYPKLMEAQVNNSGGTVDNTRMARRLAYPQEEYTENSEYLQKAITDYLKGPDNMGTDVWWAKKN